MTLKSIDNDNILRRYIEGETLIHANTIGRNELEMGVPFAAVRATTDEVVGYFEFWNRTYGAYTALYSVSSEDAQDVMNTPVPAKSLYMTIKRDMLRWAQETNAKNFVVGINGCRNSTVVAMLLRAIFGRDHVYGVMMPQEEQAVDSDSKYVCSILGIHKITMDIGESVNSITSQVWNKRKKNGIYPSEDMEINLSANIRMAMLHTIGKCVEGRVISTSNLSEDITGYAVRLGDNVGDYAPLRGLTLTEVKVLGRYLIGVLDLCGCEHNINALTNLVTGVDWDYEERLGFTYTDLDKFIRFNEGSDEFKKIIKEKYKKNKLEIIQMPQPDFSHLPNFVKNRNICLN